MIAVVFSKDRAMQLDGTLNSLLLHCTDYHCMDLRVLHTASDERHERQYRKLAADFAQVQFVQEKDFRRDLLRLLGPFQHVLFLVDDNIFVRDFSISEITAQMNENPEAIGFSLRLGRNNTHYYMEDKPQPLPEFIETGPRTLKYAWTSETYDFGFPLEVSSSIYRIFDLWPVLTRIPFANPNTLEFMLAKYKPLYAHITPRLLCYSKSVAFCNPVNIVNTVHRNRAGGHAEYTSESLSQMYEQGYRIDAAAYTGFLPSACHQEVRLVFRNILPVPRGGSEISEPASTSTHTHTSAVARGDQTVNPSQGGSLDGKLEMGRALYDQGRFDEAVALFQKIIRESPLHAEAHNDLACALWALSRPLEAMEHLKRVIEISPGHHDALWNLNQMIESAQGLNPGRPPQAKTAAGASPAKTKSALGGFSSISVIIPAYNCEKTILQTLQSAKESIEVCLRSVGHLEFEVIVVDDNSTDQTFKTVETFVKEHPGFSLIRNPANMGAGPSRNNGVRNSKGDLLFFLDGDDLFLPEHVLLCVYLMRKRPEVHMVKTQIRIDEEIHPYWKNAIEKSVPINICVRRWCHEMIGGYPEGAPFKILRCEDMIYRSLLSSFFVCLDAGRETVHHFRYPGNALDRQMIKFSNPPDADIDAMNEAEKEVWPHIQNMQDRIKKAIEGNLRFWQEHLSHRFDRTQDTAMKEYGHPIRPDECCTLVLPQMRAAEGFK